MPSLRDRFRSVRQFVARRADESDAQFRRRVEIEAAEIRSQTAPSDVEQVTFRERMGPVAIPPPSHGGGLARVMAQASSEEAREAALAQRLMELEFERTQNNEFRRPATGPKGSVVNPFTPEEMKELVDELAESENLPNDIHLKLLDAFTKEMEVNYRLHIEPDEDTCDVFINETFIMQLKGLGRDPLAVGKNFLEIVTDKLFQTTVIDRTDPSDDYGNDL